MKSTLRTFSIFLIIACRTLAVSDEAETIPFGATWTWHHPTNGEDPETSQPGFNANWMKASYGSFANSGSAQLGYGTNDFEPNATTIGTPISGLRYTAYFKKQFSISAAKSGKFYATLLCDDGCVIYIDGVRVGTFNFSGTDLYYQAANTTSDESSECVVELDISSLSQGGCDRSVM